MSEKKEGDDGPPPNLPPPVTQSTGKTVLTRETVQKWLEEEIEDTKKKYDKVTQDLEDLRKKRQQLELEGLALAAEENARSVSPRQIVDELQGKSNALYELEMLLDK